MFETYMKRLKENITSSGHSIPSFHHKPSDANSMKLSVEVKYEIATTEYDYLKTCVDEGKTKSDNMIETLRVNFSQPSQSLMKRTLPSWRSRRMLSTSSARS